MSNGETKGESGTSGPGRWFWGVLGLLAAAGVATLMLAGGGAPDPVGPLSQAETNVEADSGAYAAVVGPEDAPVTLREFADYTCPHCARFAALPGPALKRDYARSGQVRFLFYDFPLRRQGNSIPSALAARCAGDQGRYWDMHDMLYSEQGSWARDPSPEGRFADYARELDLDVGAFNECYSNRTFLEEIMASRRYGEQLGVSGTPALIVDGTQTEGYGYEAVASLIEERLAADSAAGGAATSGGAGSGP